MTALVLTDGHGHQTRIPLSAPVPTPGNTAISLGGDTRGEVLLDSMTVTWLADLRVAIRDIERQLEVNAKIPVREPSGLCNGQDDPGFRHWAEGVSQNLRRKYGSRP